MRDTLLGLYEYQVVDNLIRTKQRYPIIQVDYNNLTGTLSQQASGNVGGTETNVHNTPGGPVGTFLRKVSTSVFNYSLGASQTAALAMTGQPVISNDRVYKVYVDAILKDQDLVRKADRELKAGDYHVKHMFITPMGDRELWYVPTDKKEEFFNVYLSTTVFRQEKVVELDVRSVIELVDPVIPDPSRPKVYNLTLILKDKIPNDTGEVVVPVNGPARRYRYRPLVNERTGDLVVPRGELTDRVAITYFEDGRLETGEAPMPVADFIKAILGKSAIFRNDTFVAGAPSIRNQLEEIRSQQELQRLQQFGR